MTDKSPLEFSGGFYYTLDPTHRLGYLSHCFPKGSYIKHADWAKNEPRYTPGILRVIDHIEERDDIVTKFEVVDTGEIIESRERVYFKYDEKLNRDYKLREILKNG